MMTKNKLMLLALITIIGFSGISFVIHYFTDERSFFLLFYSKVQFIYQIGTGSLLGVIIGEFGWWLTQTNLLKPETSKYTELFKNVSLNFIAITFVSLCAGIGEEVFLEE